MNGKIRGALWLLSASAMVAPVAATAATTSRAAQLAQRLEKLEAEVRQLHDDLHTARDQQEHDVAAANARADQAIAAAQAQIALVTRTAEAAQATSAETSARLASAVEAAPKQGFRSGNSNVVLSGYIKLLASSARYSGGDDPSNTLGRDLYLPQSIPVFNPASPTSPTHVTDFTAKQTRFWVDANTKVGSHALKAYIEFDFQAAPGTPQALGQGTQRTTNAYDLAMRRAFVQFDRWLFGQDFTNFSNPAVFPESTDYVGGVDGLVFVRQPMARYSLPLGKGVTLHLAAENPETASANAGSAALIENGQDHAPDFTARLEYGGKPGFLYFAALGRQLRVDNAKANAARITDSRFGWGVSAGGKLFLNDKHSSDLRFQATYGEGIGRYLGLNFGPDAVLQASGQLGRVRNLGAFGAARIALGDQWRVNLMGSYQHISYAGDINRTAAAGIAMYNREGWSVAGNVFTSPVKNVDLGIEVRHGERHLVNGLNGHVERFDFAAKYSF
ncbi:DcaP family trimeric outer membrane transporter [Novosphingobium sp. FKTRR1]|uniref:DcaP family trimeric outer membrane transporter n=1 Tax=Novosphingobium sp. FKTRR1 TaxID=2879118 RepID=UPI001CF0642D|nr:DcaP family trimeric outer membrane transporter [Novosphingobium sp. FKTRR1]